MKTIRPSKLSASQRTISSHEVATMENRLESWIELSHVVKACGQGYGFDYVNW